jgi:hypothetical protein
MQKSRKKAGSLLWLIMNNEPVPYSRWTELKKWVPSIILLPVAIYLVLNRGNYGLIDNADLVIHEAGHFFFMFFGKFIYTAGGTLMQIIIPSLIIFYFFRNMYCLGVQIGMLWLGQNLINISVYAADAKTQKLPLLGGHMAYHDWHYMLGKVGLLDYSNEVGYFFVGIAIIIFIVMLIMPFIIVE